MVLSGAVISGNIVSGNQIAGIGAWGENITITGNYVGTDSTGMIGLTNISDDTDTGDFPFFGAVTVYGNNITIGGPLASDRNIISGNDGDGYVGALGGILIVPDFENGEPSQNITILNNYIGVAADGVTPLSNATSGIFMLGGAIDSLIQNNIIANSLSNPFFPSAGVIGFENTVFNLPIRNVAILENSIYGQTFAIDYFSDPDGQFDPNEWILVGINPNDPGDTDEGPNDLQNYPVITQASAQNGNALITFSADFQAGDYRIEFFRNSQEVRWLESFVGFMTITHAGNGPQVFTATLPLLLDDIVTATATRINPVALSGFGSTSEGGNPFRVTLPTATTPRRSSG
ncbi:MAG: hypothetical protein LRY41_00285, partial [Candidatus Pacebacteria bacterium]|nr:hypothetical protein [Candidatus Paceibacterota bacterium]